MNRLDENLRSLYINYLQRRVSPHRFQHSLGVAETAVRLAVRYGADPAKAEAAGLLHDCSKGMSHAEMIEAAYAFHLQPDIYQLANPETLHPHLSAEMARRDLHLEDEEVLLAIARHMSGAPEMTVLDAVVNLADYIEPSRNYPDVEEIRGMAEGSLFDTLCECIGRTMILVIKSGSVLHPDTLRTWNALKMRTAAQKGEAK